MIQITNSVKLILAGLTLVAMASCVTPQASAQGIEAYLRKADLDNDGKIEPHEMTGPIKRFLSSKGYDIEERHRIKEIVKRVLDPKQGRVAVTKDLKVPKFGVDLSAKVGVTAFGSTAEKVAYSEEVTKKARELLEQYDRNENGILDEGEISKMSWGSPRPSANDKNGDGRLSFQEIQGRYHDREVAKQRSDPSSNGSERSGGEEQRSGDRSGDRDGRGRYGRPRDNGDSNGRSASFAPTSKSTTVDTERKKLDRAEQYVEQYFKSRDLDNNNLLEGDELKKVNSSSRSKYDKNRDGKITKAEVLAVMAPSTQSSRSTTAKSSSGSGSSRSSKSGTSSRTSSSFSKVDANEDRLVQMHEFSETWTKKQLDEFKARDANSDGVISPDEW